MKKITRLAALLGGVSLSFAGVSNSSAEIVYQGQAPASIAGTAIAVQVTSGTGIFATNGYYLLISTNSGSSYSLVGAEGVLDSGGTYSYSASNSVGVIQFTDTVIGQGTNTLNFITATNGQLTLSAGEDQLTGNFELVTGVAPATLANHSYFITIGDGAIPFANHGAAIFSTMPDGVSYNVFSQTGGVDDSSGTYTYEVTNNSTGYFCLEDSLSGNSTEYFAFTGTNSGIYMVTQPYPGGFQVGSFTVSNLIPTMFFMGQADLSGPWDYLAFTNGTPFGYYDMTDFHYPLFYHLDMGFEWFFDAHNDAHGAYLYDFASDTFFYTDPATFPYLYDFNLNAWLYYFPDSNNPGRYTSNPRWFYNFSTGQFINK